MFDDLFEKPRKKWSCTYERSHAREASARDILKLLVNLLIKLSENGGLVSLFSSY